MANHDDVDAFESDGYADEYAQIVRDLVDGGAR